MEVNNKVFTCFQFAFRCPPPHKILWVWLQATAWQGTGLGSLRNNTHVTKHLPGLPKKISQDKRLHVKHPITLQSQAECTPTALNNREPTLPRKPIKTEALSSGTHEMGYECIALVSLAAERRFFRPLLAPFPDIATPLGEPYTEPLGV